MKRLIALWVVALAICGCISTPDRPRPLAIAILEYERSPESPGVELLPHDYGVLIKGLPEEKPEFFVYDRPHHKIVCPSDFQAFLCELENIPSGSRVDWVNTCTVPLNYGMPETESTQLERVPTKKRLHRGGYIICTCESKELRLLKVAR